MDAPAPALAQAPLNISRDATRAPACSASSGGVPSTPSCQTRPGLPHSGSSDSMQALLLVAHVHRLQAMQAPSACSSCTAPPASPPASFRQRQAPASAAARQRGPVTRAATCAAGGSRAGTPASPGTSSSGILLGPVATAPPTPSHAEARAILNRLFAGGLTSEEQWQLQQARKFLAAF